MAPGRTSGAKSTSARQGAGPFLDGEGGYTSLAVACALLVSFSLVFALAGVQWSMSRAADVQEVADACALAGENVVAGFSTVVQVVDACVLSLGLSGLVVYGAGLIVAALPVLQEASPPLLKAGRSLLEARRSLARSASEGLSRLEKALPAVIALNAASCASANSTESMSYVGSALPFPTESASDWSSWNQTPDTQELEERAEALRKASERKARFDEQARQARERAWHADNIDDPSCLRGRAEKLAGLSGSHNPVYPSASQWKFGYARIRAMNYYATRASQEQPASSNPEEMTRSAARKRFFLYAYQAIRNSVCREEGSDVEITLPELPHNTDMVKSSSLYTEAVWPCTLEPGGKTLHGGLDCPGATGSDAGLDSLSSIDAGSCQRCAICGMDAKAMGRVASASTNINNGFEYYWQIIVEASREYQQAKQGSQEEEREMQERAEEGKNAFDQAKEALSLKRPKICPAGAWGCVAVVSRPSSSALPEALNSSFVASTSLAPGAAIAGATLAPDSSTDEANIMRHVLDGVRQRGAVDPVDVIGSVGDLWGSLLVGYGSAFEGAFDTMDSLFDRIGGLFGEWIAQGLKEHVSDAARDALDAAGLTPSDVRLRKPVLVNSQTVLDKAGLSSFAQARRLIEELPDTTEELLDEYVPFVMEELGYDRYTVAELPIPGTEITVPLTIDLKKLWQLARAA